jgi:hypothetical protein
MPPKDSRRGRWSYDTIPPCWLPDTVAVSGVRRREGYRWTMLAEDHRSVSFGHEEDRNSFTWEHTSTVSPPSVPVMVPAPWKNWVENLVALLRVPAEHGVQINISLGAAAPESRAVYSAETQTIPMGPSKLTGRNLLGSVREYSSELNIFRKNGDYWSITYKGQQLPPMSDQVGFAYISLLLQSPMQPIAPLQLVQLVRRNLLSKGRHNNKPIKGEEQVSTTNQNTSSPYASDDILDERARIEIGEALKKLMKKREEAEQSRDSYRVHEIQKEIDETVEHYAPTIGLGGKSRKFNQDDEKARSSVKKAINRACEKISKECASLARHLTICIETGYSCSYKPHPEIEWNH